MVKFKDKLLNELKQGDKTIQELCELLDLDDDFKIISIIAELEIEKKVCLKSMKPFYDNTDGDLRLGYMAKYGVVEKEVIVEKEVVKT